MALCLFGWMFDPQAKAIKAIKSEDQNSKPRECKRMTPVYSYSDLEEGDRIDGPALVESAETSCVIPQQWCAEADAYGALKVWRD